MPALKTEPKSITDTLKDFYRDYLSNNEVPKTKADFDNLKRMTWNNSKIELKKDSRNLSKVALLDVLKEKGFELPDGVGNFKKSASAGAIEATFDGAGKKVEQIANSILGNPPNKQFGIFQQNAQSQQSPVFGSMPSAQTSTIERKALSDNEKASNKRFIKQTMQLPKNLWVQFGIVDSDDLTEKEKPQSWGEEVDNWAESLADWCNENGYSFPAKMEMILICVSGISLFIFPLLMKMIGMKGEKKKESIKKMPNKLDEILEKEKLV